MATLYRKYRPQTFKEVVGQNHIKIALEQQLKTGKLAHSYLFCGPRAVGKTTLARVMAKAFNCLNRPAESAEPCNECSACKSIMAGAAMDIIEIDAASNTGVDNVRDNIIAGARVAPSSLKYKVYIIDEVHMISNQAFNALLKTMEEPPANVVFILCTTEAQKIPPTIISRCQRFDFKKISVADVVGKLEYILQAEGVSADKEVLESVARYSGGHMRDAESIMGQIIALAETADGQDKLHISREQAELVIPKNDLAQALELINFLANREASAAIHLINEMLDDGFDLKNLTSDIIELARQIMLIKVNPALAATIGTELGETLTQKILAVANKVNVQWAVKVINSFTAAKNSLKDSGFVQLPLEIATVEMCELGQTATAGVVNSASGFNQANKNEPIKVLPNTKEYAKVAEVISEKQPIINQVNIPFEEIVSRWPEFMASLKEKHQSLFFVLKMGMPTGYQMGNLQIAFKHKIHKDRLVEQSTKSTVEDVLAEVYNARLMIEAILEEVEGELGQEPLENAAVEATMPVQPMETAPAETQSSPAIDEVLKAFGGRIVN